MSSALTNTSSKAILNAYPQPITLTIVQFAFVSFWCWLSATVATLFPAVRKAIPALRDGLRSPSREVFNTTLPLALFQLGGHVLSSTATQKIPVSLVHTIKGLSPLFTVMAYRFIFHIHYSVNTYLSLIPLTGGVMLACSAEFSGNLLGIVYALVAALIFVTQNIFSKKIFNEAARAEADSLPPSQFHPKKLDKLNLLFYCSGMALVLNFPLWLWTEGFSLIGDVFTDGKVSLTERPHSLDHGPLALEFIFNGIFHFGQNIIAFVLLSMVSPVTYSVASLIKRVFVVVVAILWFRNDTTTAQGVGIAMTFLGLYLYDRTSDAARAAKHVHKAQDTPLLPLNTGMNPPPGVIYETPVSMHHRPSFSYVNGAVNGMEKKSDGEMPTRPRRSSRADWLPPGTKQEETWRMGDIRT
jgi:solute carrier family 35 protein E1